jgi:hypothetical protein
MVIEKYINLAWLNTLGNWEYFYFKANKSYGEAITTTSSRNTDVFINFDTDFIAGGGDQEDLRIESRPFLIVRSQSLDLNQLEAIKNIRSSISVYDVSNSPSQRVIVNKGSFQYFTDRDKRKTLEFQINYPKNQIQIG